MNGTRKSRLSGSGNVPNTIGGTFLSRPEAYPNAQSNYGIGISHRVTQISTEIFVFSL